MEISAIDIFSGCGGLSCGLVRAGFKVKAAVEIETAAAVVYKKYEPLSQVNVLEEDICKVNGAELLNKAGISADDLYLFAGCPPCQNFSRQNSRNKDKTDEERKKLLFEFLRVIKEIHPPFILMENVPGIKSEFNRKIFDEFIEELKNSGGEDGERYEVHETVLNAADYGVPQVRRRFVLHAVRYDLFRELEKHGYKFNLPAKTHCRDGKNGLQKWVTVAQAIGDLPEIAAGGKYEGDDVDNHRCAGLSQKNLKRIKAIREAGGSRTGLPDELVLDCHKKEDSDGNVFVGRTDVYGIMDGNKPSPTITCGCLCYSKGRYGHYTQDRAISVREAARLQTFPDDFKFSGSLVHAATQIGNAVPIKLVEESAKELFKAIEYLKKVREPVTQKRGRGRPRKIRS